MSRQVHRAGAAMVAVAVVGVVVALATGSVVLVTTHGISMEPLFHTGDLAVVVPSASYHVGEIVAYHSPLLHIVVLHRVLTAGAGFFTFKGDNNHFVDPVRVPASAIVGRLVLHLHGAGAVLDWLHSPPVLAFLAAGATALVTGRAATHRRRSRQRQLSVHYAPRHAPRHTTQTRLTAAGAPEPRAGGRQPANARASGGHERRWLALPVTVIAVSGLFAWLAWQHPAHRTKLLPLAYAQAAVFTYSAKAPAGVAYPDGAVTTGTAVFTQLVKAVTFRSGYVLRSDGVLSGLRGTISSAAVLQGPDGWAVTVASSGPEPFSGRKAATSLTVSLTGLPALEQRFAAETGVAAEEAQLSVRLRVQARGRLDGVAFSTSYGPSIALDYGPPTLTLPQANTTGNGPEYPELHQSTAGSAERHVAVAATFSFLGRHVPVPAARSAGAAGAAAGVLGCALVLFWARRRAHLDEPARLRARYGHDLVTVGSSPAADDRPVVDVPRFEDMARLARNYECAIFYYCSGAAHEYYLELGRSLFRYSCGRDWSRAPLDLADLSTEPPVTEPSTLQPSTLQPTGLQPTGLQPTGLQPTGLQPTGLQPTGLQPVRVRPVSVPARGPGSPAASLRPRGRHPSSGPSAAG